MIPKIIHYCWISGEENMEDDVKKCIESWHKYLPDYEFINWNDSNFDWNICEFTKHCRENNLYAFCSDYIRFWALYNYGGFYLDTDVMVKKSFNELLNFRRVITNEYYWQKNRLPESAIIGSEKGDDFFRNCIDWYNKCERKFKVGGENENYVISPEIMRQVIVNSEYKVKTIHDLKDYKYDTNKNLTILDCTKYFNNEEECSFAEHLFKSSWWPNKADDCTKNDNLKIFLCAHKPIENYIPKNKKYVIIDVTGKADNSYNDNFHEVIDISNDEFTKNHNVCYGEGCAIKYLYDHPDLIPEYICFGHYRRVFINFVDFEKQLPRIIESCGAIITPPNCFLQVNNPTNRKLMRMHHPREDANIFLESLMGFDLKYKDAINEFLSDNRMHSFNCFAMKKEDFIEMCEFCFGVLDLFDKKRGFKNNEDVLNHMMNLSKNKKLLIDKPEWQARLQGFYLEYLTDIFYRYKFKGHFIESPVGIAPISIL